MRSFDAAFGPVNSERWILRLYEETNGGIRGLSPSGDSVSLVAGESQTFSVNTVFGPDVQSITWMFNSRKIVPEGEAKSLTLSPAAGTHQLTLTVQDVSGAIRMPPPHPGIFNWNWTVEVL